MSEDGRRGPDARARRSGSAGSIVPATTRPPSGGPAPRPRAGRTRRGPPRVPTSTTGGDAAARLACATGAATRVVGVVVLVLVRGGRRRSSGTASGSVGDDAAPPRAPGRPTASRSRAHEPATRTSAATGARRRLPDDGEPARRRAGRRRSDRRARRRRGGATRAWSSCGVGAGDRRGRGGRWGDSPRATSTASTWPPRSPTAHASTCPVQGQADPGVLARTGRHARSGRRCAAAPTRRRRAPSRPQHRDAGAARGAARHRARATRRRSSPSVTGAAGSRRSTSCARCAASATSASPISHRSSPSDGCPCAGLGLRRSLALVVGIVVGEQRGAAAAPVAVLARGRRGRRSRSPSRRGTRARLRFVLCRRVRRCSASRARSARCDGLERSPLDVGGRGSAPT